jgi:hypothetical protein
MRLITAITLIFLPATFVATFFNTSFWDFAPENEGAKVSRWVWLYAVVTMGLTLLVLAIWLNFDTLVGATGDSAQNAFWHNVEVYKGAEKRVEISDGN